jgi:hypothetical protein
MDGTVDRPSLPLPPFSARFFGLAAGGRMADRHLRPWTSSFERGERGLVCDGSTNIARIIGVEAVRSDTSTVEFVTAKTCIFRVWQRNFCHCGFDKIFAEIIHGKSKWFSFSSYRCSTNFSSLSLIKSMAIDWVTTQYAILTKSRCFCIGTIVYCLLQGWY